MMIKRFDRLDVVTSDLLAARTVYERNFGFEAEGASGANVATIKIGDAQIRLRAGAQVADLISASGEGLAAIWLEADDVEAVAATLKKSGVTFAPIYRDGDRRVLAVDARAANMVSLYIFDRKT
jgi:predicted enzyme related to lactoylglutathione lyase